MDTDILIYSLAFFGIAFAIYKIYKWRSANAKIDQSLSDTDLKPYFDSLNLEFEEKARKQWLAIFLTLNGFIFLNSIYHIYNGDTFLKLSEKFGVIFPLIFAILCFLLIALPILWFTYYCAYKKRGTALLMFIIVTYPLELIFNIGYNLWTHAAAWDIFGWILTGISLGLDVLLWIASIRLWKVNTARKHQKILAFQAKFGSAPN